MLKWGSAPLFYLTPLAGIFILPQKSLEFDLILNDL